MSTRPFSSCRFNTATLELVGPKGQMSLRPQLGALLSLFLDRPMQVLSKESIITAVWEDSVVSDDAVFRAIRDLRHALAECGCDREMIKTIPKGYQWTELEATTAEFTGDLVITRPSLQKTRDPKRISFKLLWILALTPIAAWSIWTLIASRNQAHVTQHTRLAVLPVMNLVENDEYSWIRAGLTDAICTSLAEDEKLETLPLETVLNATSPSDAPHQSVVHLTQHTGVDYTVSTQIEFREDVWRLGYVIFKGDQPFKSGQCLGDSPMAAARELVKKTQSAIGRPYLSVAESLSPDPYLNETYAKGLEKLDAEGPAAALPFFEICVSQDPNFLWARLKLATCLFLSGDPDRAMDHLQSTIKAAEIGGRDLVQAAALLERAERYADLEENDSFKRDLARAREIYTAIEHPYGLIQCDFLHAHTFVNTSRSEEALPIYDQLMDRARSLRDHALEAKIYNNIGLIHFENNRYEPSRGFYLKALDLAQNLGSRTLEATILGNISLLEMEEGNYESAIKRFEQLRQIYAASGNRADEGWIRLALAFAHYYGGSYGKALDASKQAQTLLEATGNIRLLVFAIAAQGYLELFYDQGEIARATIDHARSYHYQDRDDDAYWFLETVTAWCELDEGHLTRAQERMQAFPSEYLSDDQLSLMVSALVAYHLGAFHQAAKLISQARERQPHAWQPGQQLWLEAMTKASEMNAPVPLPSLIPDANKPNR